MEYLRALWRSEDWPDEFDASLPIIDPDVINLQFDFRDETPTSIPAALWQTRRAAVDRMLADLKAKRVAAGLGVILKQVLGDPPPADLASLRDNLAKGIDVAATTTTITDTLHLTLDSFGRLMTLKDKDDTKDARSPVSDAEWDEVYTILTQA